MIKILFVDDDPNILSGFRAMLHSKRREWKARYAGGSEAGLLLVKEETFDVVVADMRMPGMNGADFLLEVERLQPAAIRIVLSGYSEIETVLKSVKPAHQFISKPCSSENLIATLERVTSLRHILANEGVRSVVGKLESLPALPHLFLKMKQELSKPEPSLKRLGGYVEQDMGVSASILKLVNSSFFGFYKEISSPSHAVTLLGTEVAKGLVLGVQLIKTFDATGFEGYSLDQLWAHCMGTGAFAKALARQEGFSEGVCDNVFIAGLLHDVGKLVLASQMREDYLRVLQHVHKQGGTILDAEAESFGVTHAEVGAYLLGLWGMEEDMVKAVYGHHEPARSGEGMTPALIVHVANHLQHELVVLHPERDPAALDEEWLASQGFSDRMDAWRGTCEEILQRREHSEA